METVIIDTLSFYSFNDQILIKDRCFDLKLYIQKDYVIFTYSMITTQQYAFQTSRFGNEKETFLKVVSIDEFKYMLYNNFINDITIYFLSLYESYMDKIPQKGTYYKIHQILVPKKEPLYEKYLKYTLDRQSANSNRNIVSYEYEIDFEYDPIYSNTIFRVSGGFSGGIDVNEQEFIERVIYNAFVPKQQETKE